MIYPYDNSTQTRWDRGEFKVQLNLPDNPRPMGFCDGSPEDVAELMSIAEAGISREMVRKVLRELRDEGAILLQGRGRSAKWLLANTEKKS